jgi:hypothetical protein
MGTAAEPAGAADYWDWSPSDGRNCYQLIGGGKERNQAWKLDVDKEKGWHWRKAGMEPRVLRYHDTKIDTDAVADAEQRKLTGHIDWARPRRWQWH